MNLTSRFILILLLALLSAGSPVQAETVHGPTLGFAPNSTGSVIWPVLGISGASMLGDRLIFDTNVHGAIISARQDYALAIRNDDGRAVLINLTGDAPALNVIPGLDFAADLLAISPTGSAAAIYNNDSKRVQVIRGLPDAPELIYQFDASASSGGQAAQMAVSDDGTIVLVKSVADTDVGFWGFDASGAWWRIALDRPSAAAFFANSHDAVVADDASQTVFVIGDIARTGIQVPLIFAAENFIAVAVSADNRQVFTADSNTGNVLVVDVATQTSVTLSCNCRLTGLSRLKGSSMLRLNEPSEDVMGVLDASSGNPRIFVTPPPPAMNTQQP
jgi:hypothetical protein